MQDTRTLDSFRPRIKYPCFIKVDVEGAEVDVLRGVEEILERGVRLVIETHSENAERRCVDFLEERGYETKIIKSAWWRSILPEQRPDSHNRWLAAKKLNI
jgi:MoaA/NifB/PqqE/SkfB family radical SAM enzyme